MLNCTIGSDNVVKLNSATKGAWLNAQSIHRQIYDSLKLGTRNQKKKKEAKRKEKKQKKNKTKSNRCKDVLHEREMIILCCAFDFASIL